MRQALTCYSKGKSIKLTNPSTQKNILQKRSHESRVINRTHKKIAIDRQISDLNECFMMLKSTQTFKMNSLRQKIFASVEKSGKSTIREREKENMENLQNQFKNVMVKKKKIRQILQQSIKQTNIKQFRQCYSNQQHKINPKILTMGHSIPKTFNKNNVQKIISILQNKDQQNQHIECKLLCKDDYQIILPGQQKLKDDLIQYLKKQIKLNGEYLVTPEKKKLLYEKLHMMVKNNNADGNRIKQLIGDEDEDEDEEGKGKKKKKNQKGKNNNKQNNNKQNNKHKQNNLLIDISNQNQFQEISKINIQYLQSQTQRQSQSQQSRNLSSNQISSKQKFLQFVHRHKNSSQSFRLQPPPHSYIKKQFNSQISPFLKVFTFSQCQKSQQINKIKSQLCSQNRNPGKKHGIKQQKFMFLVQNGILFDVQKQILMNEQFIFLKDKNQNNLLHICAKNHYTDLFIIIVEKLKKASLKKEWINLYGSNMYEDKFKEKNKNNKNVIETAQLYQAQGIIQFVNKINIQNKNK